MNQKMKKLIKIFSWVVGSIITLVAIGLLITYWWISTKWTDYYSESEIITIADEINSSETLPQDFYCACDIIYPEQRTKSLAKMTFGVIWAVIINDDKSLYKKQCFFRLSGQRDSDSSKLSDPLSEEIQPF